MASEAVTSPPMTDAGLHLGIPSIADVEALLTTPGFAKHRACNDAFIARHRDNLKRYGRWWGRDPLSLWSRRWEYPFAAEAILRFAEGRPARVLDAGAGVTYLPRYLCEANEQLSICCCDSNAAYAPVIQKIAAVEGLADRVHGATADLRSLSFEDGAIDVVCCVSVLEHTIEHDRIIREFARVLRDGGALVLTFDLSLDGKFQLQPAAARNLLSIIQSHFNLELEVETELRKLESPANLLTTDYARKHAPHLLPFTHPWILAGYDLLRGYGWTGGFRSVAVMCIAATKRSDLRG